VRYLGAPIDPALLLDQGNKKLKDHEFELTADVIENHKKLVTAAPQSVKKYHTVRKGETLSAIARKHRTSVNTLCKLNRIRSTSVIRPGQKLRYR
jgi:LysM repeat protein